MLSFPVPSVYLLAASMRSALMYAITVISPAEAIASRWLLRRNVASTLGAAPDQAAVGPTLVA